MPKSKASSKKQKQKQRPGGVDFKKIKRKLGRKLPPPKNATNTEIKSKAIVLPEQSVASEKAGLAVNRKGLTLKELLQQSSHYSAKVRKDALLGLKDLFLKHPEELKLHRYAVIEKLRERISDDDKIVRETLYQLLKSVILPGCKEDNLGPLVSLMMAYIFNAMTHLALDVRLMAFKFFDLVVDCYPPSFFIHAEKILQNYEDILRKNKLYVEDKGKLKNALAGLVHCLSLLPSSSKREVDSIEENGVSDRKTLHAFESGAPAESTEFSIVMKKLKDLVPVLVDCFRDFLPLVQDMASLDVHSFDCMLSILQSTDLSISFYVFQTQKDNNESRSLSNEDEVVVWDESVSSILVKKLLGVFPLNPVYDLSKKDDDRYSTLNTMITEIFLHSRDWICPTADLLEKFLTFIADALGKASPDLRSARSVRKKQMLTLVPFIPKLVSSSLGGWKNYLLQAFTSTFTECNPESPLRLACLSAIEEMLISEDNRLYLDEHDSGLLDHQIIWTRELPRMLILLNEKHPSSSQVVLRLLLRLGQYSSVNDALMMEYENIQYSLQEFYSSCREGNIICSGPFTRLPRESQELAICCLYYFSNLDSQFLQSLAACCLCHDLDSFTLLRMIEVLHSAYKAGHIQTADHISFFVTLISRFKVLPENICPSNESDARGSNRSTFRSVMSVICSCLSQMGDTTLILLIMESALLEQMSSVPPPDNFCAMLRILVVLDSKPTSLSELSIVRLSKLIAGYLIDIIRCIPEHNNDESTSSIYMQIRNYYVVPCCFLFDRSQQLLKLVLNEMGSLVDQGSLSISSTDSHRILDRSTTINAIVSFLLLMHKDAKAQQIISSSTAEINFVYRKICSVQSSEANDVTIQERNKILRALDRIKYLTSSLPKEMETT